MVFLCGPAGNKFLFSNEGKKVASWWPASLRRLVGQSFVTSTGEKARVHKKLMMSAFFNIESLKMHVPAVDEVTHCYLATHWHGKKEVQVNPSVRQYEFELMCRLFMSITEPELISKLFHHFNMFLKGLLELPLNIPGTRFYRAMGAANVIRRELHLLVRQRRDELERGQASPEQDILSFLLVHAGEDGKLIPEAEIINDMLVLLFAGYETTSSTISLLMKYLAEQPRIYEKVLLENRAIAASKAPGELLKWEDVLLGMKYSWNVVCEVLRIASPASCSFREALADITFQGYTIPKGWKICWSVPYTHKDPSCYPNVMDFDESRFEGTMPPSFSYVPFGGGPRHCLGNEFARFNILIFLYNLVNHFEWDLLIPNEKWSYEPTLNPVNKLPVHLRPRECSN